MKALLDLPERHAQVLLLLLEKIPPGKFLWALTGSAGLRLQGVDTTVHDLDLQTDADSVYLLEQRLAEYIQVAVHVWVTEHTRSLHGQAEVDGLQVELLGDVRHRSPDGTWERPPDLSTVCRSVTWRGQHVPVLALTHEARAYEKMGRLDKASIIRSAIARENL